MSDRRDLPLIAVFAASSLAAVAMALDVVFHGLLTRFDAWVEPGFLPARHDLPTEVAIRLGDIANVRFASLVGLSVGMVAARLLPGRRSFARAVLAFSAVAVAVYSTKELVGRKTVWGVAGDSFPSGHSAVAVVVAWTVAVAVFDGRSRQVLWTTLIAVAWGGIVAWSRVIVTAHWPSDTFAGVALGLAVASGTQLLIPPRGPTRSSPAESGPPVLAGTR